MTFGPGRCPVGWHRLAAIGRTDRRPIGDRRNGDHETPNREPHELTPGELVRQTMVTTGALTNRIDRLEQRGLVTRTPSPTDRRSIIVRLTAEGLALVDTVAVAHLATERRLLAGISDTQRRNLITALRTLALDLGDDDTPLRST